MSDRLTIINGDCVEELQKLPDESIDCCVTDPPYHLTSGKKGGSGDASLNLKSPAGRARVTTGFMGMAWDGGDVAFRPEVWREVMRVLKPGGHLLSFGGTRTYHRMACAIKDAGFEIRDQIGWLYGSGFPKSLDVGKAIDKAAGAKREVVGEDSAYFRKGNRANANFKSPGGTRRLFSQEESHKIITEPSTEAAKHWEGWGTALKPAWEPIVVARKPIIGTVAENVQRFGTGAINVDGCRVEFASDTDREKAHDNALGPVERFKTTKAIYEGGKASGGFADTHSPKGRWPANVVHDGSEEVLATFPLAVGQCAAVTGNEPSSPFANIYGDMPNRAGSAVPRNDKGGSAARFFYCAKASRADRENGMGALKPRDLNWSSGNQSPGTFQSENTKRAVGNYHPTVKPTALMRWLVTLVCPVGGTVLDPFAGSGTTGRAALESGMKAILIELNPDYVKLIEQRCQVTPGLGV